MIYQYIKITQGQLNEKIDCGTKNKCEDIYNMKKMYAYDSNIFLKIAPNCYSIFFNVMKKVN